MDAGFSAARLRDKMKSAGVEPDELDAILLTHEHADHMKGVHQFTRKHAVRVYATRHTAMCVQEKAPEAPGPILKRGSLSE
ncbi:MBL fold metallo-hydrolase [Akkermansia muciniphila]|nr:MBL fold metallo-hydrolase [Akkermansia muciniphila]